MKIPTIGLSDFYLQHNTPDSGNSYTLLPKDKFIAHIRANWKYRSAGAGEGDNLERKVLVPLPAGAINTLSHGAVFFCPPRARLKVGMPVKAEVVVRQDGEEPYIQTFITPEDAKALGLVVERPAEVAQVVCYSADALLENGGKRTTKDEWEVVTLLCSEGEAEPMSPLTMARNFLEKAGGNKGVYTAKEFAEAIWNANQQGVRIQSPRRK
jgi:hypothetical protein